MDAFIEVGHFILGKPQDFRALKLEHSCNVLTFYLKLKVLHEISEKPFASVY